jgi:hypothetical protein
MLLFIEITFIALLAGILIMVYRREGRISTKARRRASVDGYWSGKERRRHVRFKDRLDVDYSVIKGGKPRKGGRTIDVSEGGLRMLIYEKLIQGEVLELIIELPGTGAAARVNGKVVWSEEASDPDQDGRRTFYSGLQFLSVREPVDSGFIRYIRSLPSSAAT